MERLHFPHRSASGAAGRSSFWATKYLPFLALPVLFVVSIMVLPSSLKNPQTQPTESAEYAPVTDGEPGPAGGNVSSFGLGSSGFRSADPPIPLSSSGSGTVLGKTPSTKRCVGNPPRQTEDPLSPPCVAYFSGSNFGATHRGVTGDEVRVIQYLTTSGSTTSKGSETPPPPGTIVDLGKPPPDNEFTWVRLIRLYQRYFNDHYQTYNRFVHFYVQFGTTNPRTPETRRANAAEGLKEVQPFAVINNDEEAYTDFMTAGGVETFVGTRQGVWQPESAYSRTPGYLWSYLPSTEQRAQVVSSYLCKKVVPYPVSFGNELDLRKPRVFAITRSTDATRPHLVLYGKLIKQQVEACGGRVVEEQVTGGTPTGPQDIADYARYREKGVTTVIMTDLHRLGRTQAATTAQFYPEWMIAGNNALEQTAGGRTQDQEQWSRARAVTNYVRVNGLEQQHCLYAAREVDPSINAQDVQTFGCDFYRDMQVLFTGIQGAGPRLSPSKLDQGFHAIPPIASTDPQVPACFYERGDYTCVKDAQTQWWDRAVVHPADKYTGCWRMMEGGRRYLAGTWPSGDVESQRNPSDPCNVQGNPTVPV